MPRRAAISVVVAVSGRDFLLRNATRGVTTLHVQKRARHVFVLSLCLTCLGSCVLAKGADAQAQDAGSDAGAAAEPEQPPSAVEPSVEREQPAVPDVPGQPPSAAGGVTSDAGVPEVTVAPEEPPEAVDQRLGPDAGEPEEPRGEAPISPEAVVLDAVGALDGLAPQEPSPDAAQPDDAVPALPVVPRRRPSGAVPRRRAPKQLKAAPPLVVWATAGWGDAFGPARCEDHAAVGLDPAIRIASTLRHSVAVAGVGVAPSGALSDHPVVAYAAERHPERLAAWLAKAGLSVLEVGVQDLTGPLLRSVKLSEALQRHGIAVIASNLVCGDQAFCRTWATAEKPLHSVQREGQRYVFISLLPDDLPMRVEPAAGRKIELQPMAEALLTRTKQARKRDAQLVVSSLDHGPDSTAAASVAEMLEELPAGPRPDLLLSPSSGENLLFMRPLDVTPAVVGTRRGVLLGVRVKRLMGERDSDVLARSVRLFDWNDELAAELRELGVAYCRDRERALPGGRLEVPLSYEGIVPLAAAAMRELADVDLALVDPLVFDPSFQRPEDAQLQVGEVERAVLMDAPLVTADVTLDWLAQLNRNLEGLRPLLLTNYRVDKTQALIAGRAPVVGALYSIVTTSVLARSERVPGKVTWRPVDEPHASMRGALLELMRQPSPSDPRLRLEDPTQWTQWVLRTDGQLLGNLTQISNSGDYPEPALNVDPSRQLGIRFVLNYDADGPRFLFENSLNVAFDRNFATKTTAQDLSFVQSSYTYRALWPGLLGYPHPFVEGYAETQLSQPSRHWLLRPKLGVRSMFSPVASLKAFAGAEYKAADETLLPGFGAELLLKPWTIVMDSGTLQLEGNVLYYWSSPGNANQHTLRGQLITSYQLVGPLQLTLTALGVLRKDGAKDEYGRGVALQAGIRLRFVTRDMSD